MSGEDRVHAQPDEQVGEMPGTLLATEFGQGGGE
jgi:hypothetical protein